MEVLCFFLVLALVSSWIYIGVNSRASRQSNTQVETQVEADKTTIVAKDNDVLTIALSRLSEEEFAAVKNGDQRSLLARIEEVKAERIPDYEFLKKQLEASRIGVQTTEKEYFDNLSTGYLRLADRSLKDWKELQKLENKTTEKLNTF